MHHSPVTTIRRDLRQRMSTRLREQRQSTPMQQLLRMRSGAIARAPGLHPVSEQMALTLSAVFCAVRIQSDGKASLPIKVYERKGPGLKDAEVTMHPVSELLRSRPNPEQTPITWKAQRQAHLSLWGNGYSELRIDGRGTVVDVWPHHPANVEPARANEIDPESGRYRKVYRVQDGDGGVRVVDHSLMLHTLGMSLDGEEGLSVIRYASGSMSVGLSSDKLVASFFDNGAKPSIVVTSPEYLDDAAFARLQRDLNEEYTDDNAFRALLLEGGMTATGLTLPLRDVQLLESRKFQGEEIACRWFGLPPHLAGFLDNAHYNNLSEQDRAWVIHSLMPYMIRDEQEMDRKLFTRREQGRFYVRHNADALLRGDAKTRYEQHRSAIISGWKTRNEVRADEDLPPLPGGDDLPSPAAIWGKQTQSDSDSSDLNTGGAAAAANSDTAGKTQQQSRSVAGDPRLALVVQRSLDGLLQTEKIQAERRAGQPAKIREFYAQHRERLQQRFADVIPTEQLAAYCSRHAAQLEQAAEDPDPPAATRLALETWSDDAAALAASLNSQP